MFIRKYAWIFLVPLATLVTRSAWADHPTVGFSEDSTGPIQTISATPLPKGRWGASMSVEYQRLDAFSDEELRNFARANRTVDSTDYLVSPSVGVAYGLTESLTLLARLPYIKRDNIRESELEDGQAKAHEHGDSAGLGDLAFLSKWRLFQEPVEVAPLLGFKAPTGETRDEDEACKKFEADHQAGSGSWDGLFGLAITRRSGSWSLSGSFLYTLATEGAQETDLGDQVTLSVGGAYRLNQHPSHHHETHRHLATDLILEAVWERHQSQVARGRKDPESGGTQLWIAPGLRLSLGRVSWATSVGIPVAQDFNGAQHEPEVKLLTVVSTSF